MSNPATLTLGYWDIRGFAEPARLLLRHLGVQYRDVRYGFGTGAAFPNRDEWLAEKFTLGLDFPNLPYLVDGDFKLTQSVAILKYLARKYQLAGSPLLQDIRSAAIEDLLEAQILDIRTRLMKAIYQTEFNTEREFQFELDLVRHDLAAALQFVEQWLAKDGGKQWLTGPKLSYVDFLGYEYLVWFRALVQSDCFDKFPQVSAWIARFEALPNLKDYLASEQYKNGHCVSPFARIGY